MHYMIPLSQVTRKRKETKMYIIIITKENSDPQVLGNWDTYKEAQQYMEMMKSKRKDISKIENMVVVGTWKVN